MFDSSIASDADEHIRFASPAQRVAFVDAVMSFVRARNGIAATGSHASSEADVDSFASPNFSSPLVRVVPAARIARLAVRTPAAVAAKCQQEVPSLFSI